MSKATPGPWQIRSKQDGDKVHRSVVGRHDRWGHPIVCDLSGSIDDEANANLIAAAPDLLAACKAARTYLDHVDTDDWPPALDAILTAAIARAEAQ
jgi:hypothetical protein